MARVVRVVAVCVRVCVCALLASTTVQANLCSDGGECPSTIDLNGVKWPLEGKTKMGVLNDVAEENRCSSVGECPSKGNLQYVSSLLQTNLGTNALELGGEAALKHLHNDVERVDWKQTPASTPAISSNTDGWSHPQISDGEKPECILHVGPHKTGTTSLQVMLVEQATMLQNDSWHQPPALPAAADRITLTGSSNMANVALFLQESSPNTSEPVWRNFVSWLQAMAHQKQNIVLSSENFDIQSVHISLLANVLSEFHTTVVIGYRLFFEWLPSFHRELNATAKLPIGTLSQWLTEDMATTGGAGRSVVTDARVDGPLFTDSLVRAYAPYFKDMRILEMNETFINTFVCSFLNAQQTCAYLANHPAKRANVRKSEDAEDACALQGGCLDQVVRTALLDRTVNIATEVASLSLSPSTLSVNRTELAQKLDAMGLCFCLQHSGIE